MAYMYYFLYRLTLFTTSEKEQPQHTANILLSLVVCFSLFVMVILLQKLDIPFFIHFFENKMYFVVMFIGSLIFNHYAYVSNGKYLEINDRYKDDGKHQKIIKSAIAVTYVLLVFVLSIIL